VNFPSRLPLTLSLSHHTILTMRSRTYIPCVFRCPACCFRCRVRSFRVKTFRLSVSVLFIYVKRQQYQVEHTLYESPSSFGSLPPGRTPWLNHPISFGPVEGYDTCCMLFSSFLLFVRTLYFPRPCIAWYTFVALSIVGLESWFRDKYIVYLSMLCTLFLLTPRCNLYNK